MSWRPSLLPAVLLLSACGDPEPAMPTGTKTVPTVLEQYERRSLVDWRALTGDLPAQTRATQLWALSVLEKDPLASLDLLLQRLSDPDPSVRLAAIVAVGRLAPPSPRAAERLVTLLEAPEEPLRRHARIAVGQLGAAAVEPLRAALGTESVRLRWAALGALGELGPHASAVTADVARLAEEDANVAVRRQARFALARLGRPGVEACVDLMRKGEPTDRAEFAAALAHAGGAVVLPMAALLADDDEDLAARAAGVLVDLGPEALPALEALLAALRRAGPVRFNAAEALLRMGAPAIERLKPLLESDDEGLAGIARYVIDTWNGK